MQRMSSLYSEFTDLLFHETATWALIIVMIAMSPRGRRMGRVGVCVCVWEGEKPLLARNYLSQKGDNEGL